MGRGYIKYPRKDFDDEEWLSEKFTKGQAKMDLRQLASYKDSKFFIRGNRIDIKRGQLGYSIHKLADRWRWSRRKVTRFLSDLEKVQQVTLQKTALTTLIYIVNYDEYQIKSTADVTTEAQQESLQMLPQKHNKQHSLEVSNAVNAVNAVNKTTTPLPPGANGNIEFLDLFPIEFQTSELFRDEWKEWLQHLKEKRKGLKLTAAKKQAKFLSGSQPETAIAIITRSIANNWTGLFELPAKKETDEERRARQLRELKEKYKDEDYTGPV